jgi:hypothetical protein
LIDGKNKVPQPSQNEGRAIDRHLGDRVRAAMEDLRHRTVLPDALEETSPRRLWLRRFLLLRDRYFPGKAVSDVFSPA